MKSNADLSNKDQVAGYNASILIPGKNELGHLIGWYQYFAMRAGKGWAEQGAAFYNKKLYDDRDTWVKSPTLKDVAMTGVSIAASMATGGMATSLIGSLAAAGITAGTNIAADALFTSADVAHGADAASAWGGFGTRALTTGLTTALSMGMSTSGLDKALKGAVGSVVYAGGMAAANRLISTGASSIRFDKFGTDDWFDTKSFTKAWDVNDISNYSGIMTAMAGSLGNSIGESVGSTLKGATNWNDKLTGGLGNLAGVVAGQAIGYGASVIATSMSEGGFNANTWSKSLDNMGGINVNLVNAGMLLDMVGGAVTMASGNQYDPENLKGLYETAGKLSGVGLFETSLTSSGVSGSFSGGGVNLGQSLWNVAKSGYGQMSIEALVKNSSQSDARQTLTDLYSYGDFAAEGLINRLGANIDQLAFGTIATADGSPALAETTTTNTGRLITMDSRFAGHFGDAGTTLLSHEAWRNGVNDGVAGQQVETADAVLAHTRMALSLAKAHKDYSFILNDDNLRRDAGTYLGLNGDAASFAQYANKAYDSSSDYWKVTKDKNGKSTKVENDNSNDVTFVDENGNQIGDVVKYDGSVKRTAFLAQQIGNGMTAAQVNQMLAHAGYSLSSKTGLFEGAGAKQAFDLTGDTSLPTTPTPPRQQDWTKSVGDWLSSQWKSVVSWFQESLTPKVAKGKDPATQVEGYPDIDPSKTMQFWDPDGKVSLGGSSFSLKEAGCRITAAGRILNAAGVDITALVLNSDKDNFFNNEGDLNDAKVFADHNLSLTVPVDNPEIALKNFVEGGSQGWVYATVPYGNGTHTININDITIGADGKVKFNPQGTSSSDFSRNFGVYDNVDGLPRYFKLSRIYIVTKVNK